MGCVHADGGNPNYVCDECEMDEPGIRASTRGWVRGDIVPEKAEGPDIENKITEQYTQVYKNGFQAGADDMLRMVRGSIDGYPEAGGDIKIMTRMQALLGKAWESGYAQGLQDGRSDGHKNVG